jgi:hypothetical protein
MAKRVPQIYVAGTPLPKSPYPEPAGFPAVHVTWEGGQRWPVANIDLNQPHFNGLEGIYIIYQGGLLPRAVRVGQGVIRDHLAVDRVDREITQCASQSDLFATWAKLDRPDRDGVERFLASKLAPMVGRKLPSCPMRAVNFPPDFGNCEPG